MLAAFLFLEIFLFFCRQTSATKDIESIETGDYEPDRINVLPGVPFDYSFAQFSGFLNASNDHYQHYLHYWLFESQGNPDKDPLVLWFNGGPGASSVNSALWEVGPFRINKDSQSLYENAFAWNKAANLVAIDSPVGVGWSYAVDGNITTTDEQTRDDCFRAVLAFFEKFPKYRSHEFYITGLSYAGVYIPMLAAKVVTEQMAGRFPTNLTGIAIENGWFSHRFYKSSVLHFLYYHGIIGTDEWHNLTSTCCPTNNNSEMCDFYAYVHPAEYAPEDVSNGSRCGNLVELYSDIWLDTTLVETYNIYQDCYKVPSSSTKIATMLQKQTKGRKTYAAKYSTDDDTSRKINYDSTDPYVGFYCWQYAEPWMNLPEVKTAMHVPPERFNYTWTSEADFVPPNLYHLTQYEMDPYFETIVKNSSARILIYNGDIDTQCDFMMARKFVGAVADQNNMTKTLKRQAWYHKGVISGYWEQFHEIFGDTKLDLLTMKGAGHFAPYSRPGPTLQMIVNFFLNNTDYSWPLPDYISTTLRPLNIATSTTTRPTPSVLL